ncbi:hypothetical protein [Pseudomonas sp. R3-18-08]|uniref:hypothetical protein n=1 Tax=Pseudomonas sp. R3-18-08 TaxID=1173283 RepID=UPI000F56331D|nr:hypothetical protein [Pseudomonas sp. R3-18-08]AZF13701.1 hypothetical protein C4J92_0184 [Pseudomonas sp. R3-18-08]
MIDSDRLRKFSWFLFSFFVFLLAFGTSGFKYFWHAVFFISFSALIWNLYLIYVCEKFALYITSVLVSVVGIFCWLASVSAYLVAARFWGKTSVIALLIGLVPIGVSSLAYLVLASGKPSFHPFEYDGIKVQPRPQAKQRKSTAYSPLLVAGATTLAASVFTKTLGPLSAGMVAMFGLTTFSVALLFHVRHIIRGLRLLRAQEKNMPKPYTFMQIDEIREARNHWWLSRLFKWIARWRKSSGA